MTNKSFHVFVSKFDFYENEALMKIIALVSEPE